MEQDKKAQEIIDEANNQLAIRHQRVTIETHFDVHEYYDFKGFNLGSQWVIVTDVDGNTDIYPADSIIRITQSYE